MSQIKAFKAYRPPKDLADKVSELPYDVCSSSEAREIAEGNPYNFYHVTKPEIDMDESVNQYDDAVYQKGRENLEKFISEGYLKQEDEDCLYLYTIVMDGRAQTGLICTVSIDDYAENRVKKHEFTREAKENDRIRHLDTLNAQTGPVFLMYKQNGILKGLFDEALKLEAEYDFTSNDGIRHTIRVISPGVLQSGFITALASLDFYIADGHHRAASAAKVGEKRRAAGKKDGSDYFLSVVFPDSQLYIMPYNRVVADLNGKTKEEFLRELSSEYEVSESGVKEPKSVSEVSMYLDGSWYTLAPKFDIPNDPVLSLDVQLLQDHVLHALLGIADPRKDNRVDFIGGIRGTAELEKLVDSGKWAVAFSMYPTTIDQLISVSDNGKVMPPKSTWFEPKLRSGLVVHKFDE